MIDDLDNLGDYDISEVKNTGSSSGYGNRNNNQPNQNQGNGSYNNNNNYQQNGGGYNKPNNGYNNNYRSNNNGNGGGYQNRPNNGGGFQRKEEVVEDAYLPVTFYVDEGFPQEAKDKMFVLASKLINKGFTVRVNGDDKSFLERLTSLSSKFVEIYIPWRNFNEIDSKHYYNTLTANHIAQTNFSAWDKIPDAVKKFMARNVRMIFGDKNNSITMALVTWSQDGANKAHEVNKETGRASFIIKTAATYHFSVVNVGKAGSENLLEKHFNLLRSYNVSKTKSRLPW